MGFLQSFPGENRAPTRPASESGRTSRWVASPSLRYGTSWDQMALIGRPELMPTEAK